MLIVAVLIRYAWNNRSVYGTRSFLVTLVLVEIWIVAQALEMSALDLPTKIVWANIQYISIMLLPATFFCLALQFTGRDHWLKLSWLPGMLLVVPVVVNVLLWTNDYHGLLRQNVYLNLSGSFPTIGKTFGPLFWVFACYNYVLVFLTQLILLKAAWEKQPLHQKQAVLLFIGLLLPALSTMLHIFQLLPFNIDPTPLVFGLAALFIYWGIFQYRIFDIVPVAYSIIIREMNTGIIIFDLKNRILAINPAAKNMIGFKCNRLIAPSMENVLGKFPDLLNFVREENKEDIREIEFKEDGTRKYYEISLIQLVNYEKIPFGRLLQAYDITERKLAGEKIRQAAFLDSLTGIYNRYYIQMQFPNLAALLERQEKVLAVAYLDLDDFKLINDNYGHDTGDKVLREAASRLKTVLRKSDITARLGGDEYAILLPNIKAKEDIEAVGRKILQAFEKSFQFEDLSVKVKASVGFSLFPQDGDNIEVLLKKADAEMYKVKKQKKDQH